MPVQSAMRVVRRDVSLQARSGFQPVLDIMPRRPVALLIQVEGVIPDRVLAGSWTGAADGSFRGIVAVVYFDIGIGVGQADYCGGINHRD